MASTLDLFILPLSRAHGQELADVPGLLVNAPPRRPARGRHSDQLLLYLFLLGEARLASSQFDLLLEDLARTYFRTPGTVSTAQRAVAESINQVLLARNLRQGAPGEQLVGALAQLVLRNDRLALAVSGPPHLFLATSDGVQHIQGAQLAGRGLGLARTAPIRYFQSELKPGDSLSLSPDPPAGWVAALQASQGQGPESLRRRLLSLAGPDLAGFLVQAQPGSGKLRLLRPVRAPRPRVPPAAEEAIERPPQAEEPATLLPEALPSSPTAVPPTPAAGPGRAPAPVAAAFETSPAAQPLPSRIPRPVSPPASPAPTPPPAQEQAGAARPQAPQRPPRRARMGFSPMLPVLAVFGRALGGAASAAARSLASLLTRMLPDQGLFTLPASTMAFIAVAIPVLLVTISTVVYLQRGRAEQHQAHLVQAVEAFSQAQASSDPGEQRQAWEGVLSLLDQAESFGVSSDSQALRAQAQDALDQLDYVDRRDFQPALVDEIEAGSHISRMVATDTDLYLLNGKEGVVWRAALTSGGYRLDPTFECGPGPYGGAIVGTIVDITALPKGNELNATLLAIDANGNLLYCIPGEAPHAVQMTPPDMNWGNPQGLTYDNDDLYVLDPQANAVWIYRNLQVDQGPRLFFGEQIPPMQDVIDMAVNLNDLYLLHTDGHLTTCVFSALLESPTRCEEPAAYTDPRPGRRAGPLMENAYFTEILFAPPPDPSIYLLDPDAAAVYHFSVRLTYQRQYRSRDPLPEGPATAFAISRGNRTVFLAIGNQVYYAPLP